MSQPMHVLGMQEFMIGMNFADKDEALLFGQAINSISTHRNSMLYALPMCTSGMLSEGWFMSVRHRGASNQKEIFSMEKTDAWGWVVVRVFFAIKLHKLQLNFFMHAMTDLRLFIYPEIVQLYQYWPACVLHYRCVWDKISTAIGMIHYGNLSPLCISTHNQSCYNPHFYALLRDTRKEYHSTLHQQSCMHAYSVIFLRCVSADKFPRSV